MKVVIWVLHFYYVFIIFCLWFIWFLLNFKKLLLLKTILTQTITRPVNSWAVWMTGLLVVLILRSDPTLIFHLMWNHIKLRGLRNFKLFNWAILWFLKGLEIGILGPFSTSRPWITLLTTSFNFLCITLANLVKIVLLLPVTLQYILNPEYRHGLKHVFHDIWLEV